MHKSKPGHGEGAIVRIESFLMLVKFKKKFFSKNASLRDRFMAFTPPELRRDTLMCH